MKRNETESVREQLLLLIEEHYDGDALFEREAGLPPKTVSNWRRGISASFMKMLPELSGLLHVSVGELMQLPVQTSCADLSEEEAELLNLYRSTVVLPAEKRALLYDAITDLIALSLCGENRTAKRGKKEKHENL